MHREHSAARLMTNPEMIEFSQCQSCDTIDVAGTLVCAKCLGTEVKSVQIPGQGTLASWTTVRKPPLKFKTEGVYHVGVFDLDRGFRVTGRYLPSAGDQIGDRVIAVPSLSPEHRSPTFKVAKHV